jgi:hypothetical protein
LNRIPVCPSIGNHDTDESEERDDRDQLMDNLYLRERLAGEEMAGRASLDPGLFYRFRISSDVEFICIDTSKETLFSERLFLHPKHKAFLEAAFPGDRSVTWRLPFCHHPPFCAGPQHHNTPKMEGIVNLFARAGVRACFSGHEHNFQHSRHDDVNYFVTGAGSKIRPETPDQFAKAHVVSWAPLWDFLLVTVDRQTLTVRAIGDDLNDIVRKTPDGNEISGPISVTGV